MSYYLFLLLYGQLRRDGENHIEAIALASEQHVLADEPFLEESDYDAPELKAFGERQALGDSVAQSVRDAYNSVRTPDKPRPFPRLSARVIKRLGLPL